MSIPTIDTLTPAMLSAIAGAIISLAFQFVPGASDWFSGLPSTHKQLFMLGVTALVAVFIAANTYMQAGLSWSAFVGLVLTLYSALTTNQVTYQFIKVR
jgi:hypothetical protein